MGEEEKMRRKRLTYLQTRSLYTTNRIKQKKTQKNKTELKKKKKNE